jgi:hypothetical protein
MLIIRDDYEAVGHLGRNSVLAEVRQEFWVMEARSTIKMLFSRDIKGYQARCHEQKMADLPTGCTVSGEAPVTSVGMDLFCPFDVTHAGSSVKRYRVVFTCQFSCAIRPELVFTIYWPVVDISQFIFNLLFRSSPYGRLSMKQTKHNPIA